MPKRMKRPSKALDDQFEVKYYEQRNSDSKTDYMQQETHEKSEDILLHDGVIYERITDDYEIDLDSIPDHVKDDLASTTIKVITEFIRQPGGREFLDEKIALRKGVIEAR